MRAKFVNEDFEGEEPKEYFEELLKYIDMGLNDLNNHPEKFKMSAMMNKMSLDEYIEKRIKQCEKDKRDALNKLKKFNDETRIN